MYGRLGDFLKMIGYAVLGPPRYRQLTVAWRLQGLVNALRGRRQWGEMTRRGFDIHRERAA